MITLSVYAVIMIGCVAVGAVALYIEQNWMAAVAAVVFFFTLMAKCDASPEAVAERRAKAEQAARDAQPHPIREVDGCKVYAWKDGSWHYFTRCGIPGTVSTDRNYTVDVKCGKNCVRHEPHTETIVTEEK